MGLEPMRVGGVARLDGQSKTDARPDGKANRKAQVREQNNQMPVKGPKLGETELLKVIERANKALQGPDTSFRFSIHEGTREIMVKVVDNESGEVIREIPPEKILDMVARLWEMAGIFVDERR